MKASPDLLMAFSAKLTEIADNCIDVDTQSELYEFIEVIDATVDGLLQR